MYSSIVPKSKPLINSGFPVDKFKLLYYLHHCSEGYKLASEQLIRQLTERRSML
jgi:hypothetical protein